MMVEMVISKEGEKMSDNVRNYLKRIQGSAQRMRLLTDRLRNFYEISNMKPRPELVDLNIVAEEAVRLCPRDYAQNEWLKIPQSLPPVKADHGAMVQLFQNLMSNALKFQVRESTPSLTITSRIVKGRETGQHEAHKNGDYLCLDFADNGIGFEQHGSDVIFQLFHRLNVTYPGTGIGLAICKKVVELHHGFISVDSEVGAGSTFHVFLPLHKS